MTDTEKLNIGALGSFCILLMCSITLSFAGDKATYSIEERVKKEVGQFSIEIYPHSEKCVRVYQIIEKRNYLACDTQRGIEYALMRRLDN